MGFLGSSNELMHSYDTEIGSLLSSCILGKSPELLFFPDEALGIISFWNECPQTISHLWVLISKRAEIPKWDGNSFCSGLPGIAAEHKESTDQISLTDANKLLFY